MGRRQTRARPQPQLQPPPQPTPHRSSKLSQAARLNSPRVGNSSNLHGRHPASRNLAEAWRCVTSTSRLGLGRCPRYLEVPGSYGPPHSVRLHVEEWKCKERTMLSPLAAVPLH